MITRDIAESIVRETMHRLHRNINMMDIDGRIIASGDRSRLGELHEGALEAISTGKALIIDEANRQHWKGSHSGINVPVVFRGQIVGAIGITGEPREVAEFGEIVKMTTELMLNQTIITSEQEWRNRAKESIMEELMKENPDFDKVDDRLRMLGLRMRPSYYAVIVETDQETEYKDRLIRKLEDIAGADGQALAGVGKGQAVYMLLYGLSQGKAAARRERMAEVLTRAQIRFRMGYSLPAKERSGIPAAFREAEFALRFGGKEEGMTSYAGLEPRAIVSQSDADSKRRFAERLLGELPEQLIGTLQAFFDCNLSIQDAAQSLYVHRNTLIYRLKRIKELTGCDPQLFRDAAALQMAVWIVTETERSSGSRNR